MTSENASSPESAPAPEATDHPSHAETPLTPATKQRVLAIDVLRGVAVLGILAMNIYAFAMPFAGYNNPLAWGGTDPLSMTVWFLTHVLFDQKFMPIFSMLFGAGLVLMDQRAGDRPIRSLWYRRELWLLVIGAAHGYLLWYGDILFAYAVLGMLIYPLRRARPRTLLITGTVLMLVGTALSTGGGFYSRQMIDQGTALEAKQEAGETLTGAEKKTLEQWEATRSMIAPSPEDLEKDVEIYSSGSYLEIAAHRVPMTSKMQTMMILFFGLWRMGGLMLWGMALMKLGIFSAERDDRFYSRLALAGYGLGLPLLAVSAWRLEAHRWDPIFFQIQGMHWNYIGSLGIALGHVSLVMLACRRDLFPALRQRFQAVGQMALSNYLMHSVICTTIFYGYGLGLFGSLDRPAQMLIVLAVWILQLLWSPWWLARMRFGPAEWLWRSLTYRRLQPLRR